MKDKRDDKFVGDKKEGEAIIANLQRINQEADEVKRQQEIVNTQDHKSLKFIREKWRKKRLEREKRQRDS